MIGSACDTSAERPPLTLFGYLWRAVLVALFVVGVAVLPERVGGEERYEPSTRGVRSIIADRAEAHGVSPAALLALANCETGSTFDPRSVGDHGTSLGLFQLNTLPTGLYWHFLSVGYLDWTSAWEQADYVANVAAGAFPGIYLSRWSCWRIVRGGW